jgi:serine/threonine protein kinase
MVGRFRLEHALDSSANGRFAGESVDGTRVTIELMQVGDNPDERVQHLESDPAFAAQEGAHLVPVLDFGVAAGRVFVAMPELQGTDARRLIAERGPVESQTAVRIILQACRGVMELQAAGGRLAEVRASDLWLVSGPGDEVTVKVAPLGSAREVVPETDGLTGTDVVLLRSFVAPERRSAPESLDERSTVWSLGACLYWLLGGSSPGSESSVQDNVVSIQDVAPWVTPGLTIALHLALQPDPDQRWPTVEAFASALLPYSGDSEQLYAGSLVAIDPVQRRRVAERADPQALGSPPSEVTSSDAGTASSTGLFGKAQHEPARLASLIGHKLGGRWKMLRVIGRGGMGAVFEVEDPHGSLAAAKVIDRRHIGEDEEHYKRFFREAKSAALVNSPHVVRTIEGGVDEELKAPFIIMELLRGVDLKSVLRERGALSAQPALRLFVQAARGIADAHHQQIIHRDIKPANLFLHEGEDGRVTVKVCDFGIAKRASEVDGDQTGSHELTRTGSMLGSPIYMSPEQASNARKVDRRTDIWSLCISLYEALSGTKPWAGRSALGEIIVAICTQAVPPLTRSAPWLDRQLAEVVHRGLRPELARRYASVDELIAALEPFLGGSEDFTLADLEPVPPELRSMKASSLPPPPTDDESATVMGGVSGTRASEDVTVAAGELERGPRRSSIALGLVAAGAIAVAAVALGARHTPKSAVPPPVKSVTVPVQPEKSAAPPAPTSHASVKIQPPTAEVTVNGKPAHIEDGQIVLSGPPGTAFSVVATLAGGAKKSESVVLARDGRAIPDSVVVEKEQVSHSTHHWQTAKHTAPSASSRAKANPPPRASSEPSQQPQFKTKW